MSLNFMTYNFSMDETKKDEKHKNMIYSTIRDRRNGIQTTNIIPGIQCYINYLELLVQLRDKWISTAYLDLGMIPIIVAPSFMHEALITQLLPILESNNLNIYAMPGTSFILNNPMKGVTEYWAFRDDVAEFLKIPAERVTTKAVMNKIWGGLK